MVDCSTWTTNPYCTLDAGSHYWASGGTPSVAVGWAACKADCNDSEHFGNTNTGISFTAPFVVEPAPTTAPTTDDLVAAQAIDTFGSMMTVYVIIIAIIAIAMYVIIFMAASKTSNEGLKIFLIVSMFLPFFAPISFIMAIMILANVI